MISRTEGTLWPLRLVVDLVWGSPGTGKWHKLVCGHHVRFYGEDRMRRRCYWCMPKNDPLQLKLELFDWEKEKVTSGENIPRS